MNKKGKIDIIIFLLSLGLMLFSSIVVYSASSAFSGTKFQGNTDQLLVNHLGKVILAVLVLFGFIKLPLEKLKPYTKIFLTLTLGLLLLTVFIGTISNGAQRWLRYGTIGFQPSDIARFALIIHLAYLIENKGELIKDFKVGFIPVMFWTGITSGLVILQPNFSTAIIIAFVGLGLVFIGGCRIKHIVGTFLIFIPIAAIILFSASYRTERFEGYVNSLVSDTYINKQVEQATIGFGVGYVSGTGIGNSKQKNAFLPEAYSDFIFAVIGEEYGFIGTTVILTIYLIIIYRGFRIAKKCTNNFYKYVAFGLTFSIGLYAFINAAVTLGLVPTTGIPLPFLSYGGSSLVTNAAGIGAILNISSIVNANEEPSILMMNENLQ